MYYVELCQSQECLKAIIELRYSVLRKPWDKPKETATDDLESSSIHAVIKHNTMIIACGRLQNNGDGVGQIRFMAINKDFQRKGLGRLILNRLEDEAKKIHLKKIELQARENACEFYKACGYSIEEKTFLLWDLIQHYKMTKSI
jgi:N-acetylglutamate synthase-like GNAT family acetyltransferase